MVFQPNCKNCGGTIQAIGGAAQFPAPAEILPAPPSPPRSISKMYVWRLLSSDGWSIAALVFVILGGVFSLVRAGLNISIITAFVDIPFLLLGIGFLGMGGWALIWRYQNKQQVVNVLRGGESTRGLIIEVQENYSVRISGQHPWIIRYQFQVNGQSQEGKVTSLNQPGQQLPVGKTVNELYLPAAPK